MPTHFVACKIERGGFSSEKTFEIKLPDGGLLVGTGFVEYLRDENRKQLDEGMPPFGQFIDGFVMCRVLRKIDENTVLVDLPSFDVISVPKEELQEIAVD